MSIDICNVIWLVWVYMVKCYAIWWM